MEVKIDTREKFHVITIPEQNLSANMTDELKTLLIPFLQTPQKNVILNLKTVQSIDIASAETLTLQQQKFYENNASFVVCELQAQVEEKLDQWDLLELLNSTPTESEAWDIIQMEEIERELLNDEEF